MLIFPINRKTIRRKTLLHENSKYSLPYVTIENEENYTEELDKEEKEHYKNENDHQNIAENTDSKSLKTKTLIEIDNQLIIKAFKHEKIPENMNKKLSLFGSI